MDLKLAYPRASYPINIDEWSKWILNKESKNYSLTWFMANIPISHIAIKSYIESPGMVYLCFFIIDSTHRGQSLAKDILNDVYHFVLNDLKKSELWLVVDPENKKAFNLYKKEGFKTIDIRPAGIRMRKDLTEVRLFSRFVIR